MNYIEKQIKKFDNFQRKHTVPGFIYAVIKKYDDDRSGYQGALITYYGFLSLFPLLIVVTSILQLIAAGNASAHAQLLHGLNTYFPIIGNELQKNVHGLHKSGLGFVVGILVTFFGVRGVADTLRYTFNHIWQVPRTKQLGFPKNILNSFGIVVIGGLSFILATVISGFAASLGHSWDIRLFSSLVSLVILFLMLYAVFRLGITSKKVSGKAIFTCATISAIGLQILQSLGGYIITHELQHLSSLYGVFAIVLGLLFWIYLQAQVVLYALEIGSVGYMKLWPRSIDQKLLTEQDQRAYALYANRDWHIPTD